MGVVQNKIDIGFLAEANAKIMTSISEIRTTADSAKAKADQAVLWSERKGYVGKNLAKRFPSVTSNKVTYSVDDNGIVAVTTDGVTSSVSDNRLDITYLAKDTTTEYRLTGCPSGIAKIQLDLVGTNGYTIGEFIDTGNGVNFKFPSIPTGSEAIKLRIRIASGADFSTPIYFTPMIQIASIADSTYEPYLPSNDELLQTETLKSVTASAADFAAFKTAIAAL